MKTRPVPHERGKKLFQGIYAAVTESAANPFDKLTPEELRANGGRAIINEALRTMPYSEYLKTNHWDNVRRRCFITHGRRCFVCGSTRGVDVHHAIYENRGDEKPDDVFPLCRDHHILQHHILLRIAKERAR